MPTEEGFPGLRSLTAGQGLCLIPSQVLKTLHVGDRWGKARSEGLGNFEQKTSPLWAAEGAWASPWRLCLEQAVCTCGGPHRRWGAGSTSLLGPWGG